MSEPGKLAFPNIAFYLPPSEADPFRTWHKSFVIDGNSDESREKSGSIEYMSAASKAALIRVDFFNMGIFSVRDVVVDKQRLVRVELYCERMQFSAPALQVKGRKLGKPVVAPRRPMPSPAGGLGSGAPGKKGKQGKKGKKTAG